MRWAALVCRLASDAGREEGEDGRATVAYLSRGVGSMPDTGKGRSYGEMDGRDGGGEGGTSIIVVLCAPGCVK